MFDWQYYLDTYPDLRQNGVHTEHQAIQHWNIHGKNEGRNSNNKFTYILDAKQHILNIKHNVQETDCYYTHYIFANTQITSQAISIIMTASNRSKQTYFTLNSIAQSSIKDIQVIIVDDSDNDPINNEPINNEPINNEQLKSYPYHIDLIKINKSTKDWHNPLVNYNIGFKFIKGSFVIIQNAEVCHIGDVCKYIKSNAIDKNYYIFDVKASLDFDTNEVIYNYDITNTAIYNTAIYNNTNIFSQWYQSEDLNRKYHFLTGMTIQTFKEINEFSYDCTVGICYDDDDFLLKIISKNINTINVFHTQHNIGGIHLFHAPAPQAWDNNKPTNELLFNLKKNIYENTGKYIDFTKSSLEFDINYDTYLR